MTNDYTLGALCYAVYDDKIMALNDIITEDEQIQLACFVSLVVAIGRDSLTSAVLLLTLHMQRRLQRLIMWILLYILSTIGDWYRWKRLVPLLARRATAKMGISI